MSLGYGVGDITAISGLAIKVYTAYKDAPDDYRNISDEVESLHIVIKKAIKHFQDPTLTDDYRQEGQKVLVGCQNVLKDLDALIVKYHGIASANNIRQVIHRIKLGTEDITALRIRLISNTGLLNGFIQSCDSHKLDQMQAQLNNVLGLGLHRTVSRDSIVSLAGSINTKHAYKKLIKDLLAIGVTADMIKEKENEIKHILRPQQPAVSSQMDESTFVGPNQLPTFGNSFDAETSPVSAISTKNQRSRSRFGWVRPPIDFLVGPRMLAAAEAGDTQRLISALRYVRNINFVDEQKTGEGREGESKATALHKAAARGHKDIVQLLLSQGASMEIYDSGGKTPLHHAVQYGDTSVVELLLSKGAPIEAVSFIHGYDTPLHHAARYGHTSTVELLLKKGALIEARNRNGHTPLHEAAFNGCTSPAEALLINGASPEARDNYKNTLLHFAALSGQISTVELVLTKGAAVQATNQYNATPLHCAARRGYTSIAQLLLKKGASIDAVDSANFTPLHDAAREGHTSTVELLLSAGASIRARDRDNQTPLDLATVGNHTEVMKLLPNQAANLLSLETYGQYLDRGGSYGYIQS